MAKEKLVITTPKEKYNYSKKLFNAKVDKRDSERIEKEIQPALVEYVRKTGDKDFTWKDCTLTFVSPVDPKVVVDNKKLVNSIEKVITEKGVLTKEDFDRLKKEAEKEDNGKVGYFRL